MKPFRITQVITIMAASLVAIPAAGQSSFDAPGWQTELDRAKEQLRQFDSSHLGAWQGKIDQAFSEIERVKPILEKFKI